MDIVNPLSWLFGIKFLYLVGIGINAARHWNILFKQFRDQLIFFQMSSYFHVLYTY